MAWCLAHPYPHASWGAEHPSAALHNIWLEGGSMARVWPWSHSTQVQGLAGSTFGASVRTTCVRPWITVRMCAHGT